MAWFVYGLDFSSTELTYKLMRKKIIYTKFDEALNVISIPVPGKLEDFIGVLQEKLDEKLDNQAAPETVNPIELLKKLGD